MKKFINDNIWNEKLCKYLEPELEQEVNHLYQDCFQFSPREEVLDTMAFITKCFLERNKQLEEPRLIVQVKMKWDLLTIYYDGGHDPYLSEIVKMAAEMATQTLLKVDKQYAKGGFRRRKVLQPNQDR